MHKAETMSESFREVQLHVKQAVFFSQGYSLSFFLTFSFANLWWFEVWGFGVAHSEILVGILN